MADGKLNPYRDWLGITAAEPLNHYELLGLACFEDRGETIRRQYEERYAKVRKYQIGAFEETAQELLAELSAAWHCLAVPTSKTAYDEQLRRTLGLPGAVDDQPMEAPVEIVTAIAVDEEPIGFAEDPIRFADESAEFSEEPVEIVEAADEPPEEPAEPDIPLLVARTEILRLGLAAVALANGYYSAIQFVRRHLDATIGRHLAIVMTAAAAALLSLFLAIVREYSTRELLTSILVLGSLLCFCAGWVLHFPSDQSLSDWLGHLASRRRHLRASLTARLAQWQDEEDGWDTEYCLTESLHEYTEADQDEEYGPADRLRPEVEIITAEVIRDVPLETRSLTVEPDSPHVGQRVDRVVQRLCDRSRGEVQGLFDHGCVTINGGVCKQSFQRLVTGDVVELRFDPRQRYHPINRPRANIGFELIHEDRHLLVVNKPAELLTVPTPRGETNTLLDRVSEYCRRSGGRRAWPVHRLDRGVSGLLLFGKSAEVAQTLRDQFAERKPERQYLAIVAGHVDPRAGMFESYLATDKALNRFSTDDPAIGQLAITHYEVAQYTGDASLVRVWLETGRRNQIRVHFAESGHPVLGDPRYEPRRASHRLWRYRRIALHAQRLGFEHPGSGHPMRFESALPVEMERFLMEADL